MLVDAFMFYNEFDILELRLELLDEYVDRFVLVEAELNHKGGPKDLYFEKNKERYAKWLHKIVHVVARADELPSGPDTWKREKYQRECLTRGLEAGTYADGGVCPTVPDEAIVMVSDVDEIPDMSKVRYEQLPHIFCSVHMWMFEYSLEYMYVGEPWFGTVITNHSMLKRVGPNHLRDNRWKFPVFQYAGWHLSSFGDKMSIWTKFQTYAHAVPEADCIKPSPDQWGEWAAAGIHTDGKTELMKRAPDVPLPGTPELLTRLNLLKVRPA
jgi:beta-1,4-mannosyl-glycoprotein beta-1,4-N-acetylglucosaminyltransferase